MCVITIVIVFNYFNSLSVLIVTLCCPLHLFTSMHIVDLTCTLMESSKLTEIIDSTRAMLQHSKASKGMVSPMLVSWC